MSSPNAMWTITGLQPSRGPALGVMQSLWRLLGRRRVKGTWAYHLEANADRKGAHAHVWWRGDPVAGHTLSEAAVRCGAGEDVDVTHAFAPPGTRVPALTYGLKAVLENRPDKAPSLWPSASEYLALNGGQLVNASHGFWTDWKGMPVSGGVVNARTLANAWQGPRPETPFLHEWRHGRIPSRDRRPMKVSCV